MERLKTQKEPIDDTLAQLMSTKQLLEFMDYNFLPSGSYEAIVKEYNRRKIEVETGPKRILPEGYYIRDKSNPYIVNICQGPYNGLKIQISENIKFNDDCLTATPKLLYNYRILHYADLNPCECETSKKLSRIIAAIVVELLYDTIINDGIIETMES